MQYPNVQAPSPQEIYDGLKMIPNTPEGKQRLGQLAQQGKQTGSIEGGIATAILNAYNKAQATPPPPQGQVVDQVLAQTQQAAPPNPNMMGIAAPGLEQVGQQSAQQMATGGIVALAGGGPIRSFFDGGGTEGGISDAWMGGMPNVPEAPDTSAYEQDYYSAPEEHPAANLPTTTSRTVGAGESDKPSREENIDRLSELYGDMPDIAAELISDYEHRQAKQAKMNVFENIASLMGGYLGSYGSGAHRAGAGITSMLATMGEHRRSEDESQAKIDALRVKSAMQPYEMHKDLVNQVLTSETAEEKAKNEAKLEMLKAVWARQTEKMKQDYESQRSAASDASRQAVAEISANAQVRAAMERVRQDGGLNGGNRASLYNSIARMAANGEIKSDEVESYFNEAVRMVTGAGASQTSRPTGQQVQLSGGQIGWLR